MTPDEIGIQITELLIPFISALLILVITLMFKDLASKIAKGMAFKMNKSFQEGDKVILDGEKALIVKVGVTTTVFGIHKNEGELDGDYVWRYVPNDRIPFLKIEKIIFDATPVENGKKIIENGHKIDKLIEEGK